MDLKDKKKIGIILAIVAVVLLVLVGVVGYFLLSGCQYNGEYKLNGSSFKDSDDCNDCFCSWGSVGCTEMFCLDDEEVGGGEDSDSDSVVDDDGSSDEYYDNGDDGENSFRDNYQEYEFSFGQEDGYAEPRGLVVSFEGPEGITAEVQEPDDSFYGGITLMGNGFSLVISTQITYANLTFSGSQQLVGKKIENSQMGDIYRFIPEGAVGTIHYVNRVDFDSVCVTYGNTENEPPCGIDAVSWIDNNNSGGIAQVSCTNAYDTTICDAIMETLSIAKQ